MIPVRFLLTLAIALHLSGVPAVAALPCAAGEASGHDCCMRHQTETGGPTIGRCACQAPGQSGESVSAVSTTAGFSEKSVAPMLVAVGHVVLVSASSSRLAEFRPIGFEPSPPPLTAIGLRC